MRRILQANRSGWLIAVLFICFFAACGKKTSNDSQSNSSPEISSTKNSSSTAASRSKVTSQIPAAQKTTDAPLVAAKTSLPDSPATIQSGAAPAQSVKSSATNPASANSTPLNSAPANLVQMNPSETIIEPVATSQNFQQPAQTFSNQQPLNLAVAPTQIANSGGSNINPVSVSSEASGALGSGSLVNRGSAASGSTAGSGTGASSAGSGSSIGPIVLSDSSSGIPPVVGASSGEKPQPSGISKVGEKPVLKITPEESNPLGKIQVSEEKPDTKPGNPEQGDGEPEITIAAITGGILSSEPGPEMMGDLLNYYLAPLGITFSGHAAVQANQEFFAKQGETHFSEARIDLSQPSTKGEGKFVEDPNWVNECQGKVIRIVFLGTNQKEYGDAVPFLAGLRSGKNHNLKKVQYADYLIQEQCKIFPTDFPISYNGMYAFFMVPEAQANLKGGIQTRSSTNPQEWSQFTTWLYDHTNTVYVRYNFVAKTPLELDKQKTGNAQANPVLF